MQDIILVESPIDIHVNSKSIVNIICLPKDLRELAVGFLFSTGIINSVEDFNEIKIDESEETISVQLDDSIELNLDEIDLNRTCRVIDTSCGISSPWRKIMLAALERAKDTIKKKKDVVINPELLHSCMIKMQKETVLFRETGGCHGAALFDFQGNLLAVKEDIGRHNAIDKVIGEMLLAGHDSTNLFLTTTGRLTGDSVLKAIRANIPIVASLSTAIDSGIRLALAYGVTLIGFVRGARMNIYTHPERIQF